MDDTKREIRFLISRVIYDKLKEEAEELDVPLASYIKANIKNWSKNGNRGRKKDK